MRRRGRVVNALCSGGGSNVRRGVQALRRPFRLRVRGARAARGGPEPATRNGGLCGGRSFATTQAVQEQVWQSLWGNPPADLDELAARARWLRGRPLAQLAAWLGERDGGAMVHRKGKTGQLIERALGASAGSASAPDFVHLGVELKTLPLDARGLPSESTFVCRLRLREADTLEWKSSPVRHKLAHVLWVPLVGGPHERAVGKPFFWRPSAEQEAVLRADFDELVGLIAIGRVEEVTAHLGTYLQIRPKAAHGRVRTRLVDADGDVVDTIPRGFYLRARFTRALLDHATT